MKSLFENWDYFDFLKAFLITIFGAWGITQVFFWSKWGVHISTYLSDPTFFNQTSQTTQSQFFAYQGLSGTFVGLYYSFVIFAIVLLFDLINGIRLKKQFEELKKIITNKNDNPPFMTNQEFVEEEDQNEELSVPNSRHILWARVFSLVGVAVIIISVLGIWFWKPFTDNSNILAAELALYGVGIAVALFGADLSLKLESDKKLFDKINAQNSIIMQMQQNDIKRDEKLKNIEEMVKKWDFY